MTRFSVLPLLAATGAAALAVGCAAPTAAPAPAGHYAEINGLRMYYEVHGPDTGRPLVLLHGSLSGIAPDFGDLIPTLAQSRPVIGIEQQAHGHTGDIDRPLRVEHMAADTAALLQSIGVTQADVLGYSTGASIALDLGIRHPELVHKLVLVSGNHEPGGFHPGLLDGALQQLPAEALHGTPFHDHYLATAPRPEDFPRLIEKNKELQLNFPVRSAEEVRAMTAPTLLVIGDSDIVRPEHAVEMFRLAGGGVFGDLAGMPDSQLAILPGTSHLTVVHRPELLLPIIPAFLDAPVASPPAG